MSWVSVTCFSICLLLAGSALLRRADIFAPYRVFGVIWSFAIGLSDLKLSFFQREWSTYSWIVLVTGVCSMMLGFFIVSVIFLDRPMLSLSESRRRILEKRIDERSLFRIIMIFSSLYVFAMAIEVAFAGGFPAFSGRPDKARVDFGVFGLHLFVTNMPAILLLCTQYLVFFWRESAGRRRNLVVASYIIVFLTFSLLLQRFSFVMWIIPTLCFVYYATDLFKLRHLALTVLGFFGFLQIIRSIRAVGYVEYYVYAISHMRYTKAYAVFTEPYMYIVMNLENFARSVDQWTSYTYGYFTFDFLMAMTGLKHPIAKEFGLVERPFLISAYNTFSFLMPFYQDFGFIGVAFIPLFIGIIFGYFYQSMRRQPTLGNITMYSFAVSALVLSFFVHELGTLFTFMNICLLVFVHYVLLPAGRRDQVHARTY